MADSEKIGRKIGNKVKRRAKSKAKRKVKKSIRALHPLTVAICVVALVFGAVAGAFGYRFVTRNDRFVLNGEHFYRVSVGSEFVYKDEGVKVIAFGKDITDRVSVDTDLTLNADGSYTVDTSQEKEYYITYTVDSLKYGKTQRVRRIIVGG